jgi:hypothetical protein
MCILAWALPLNPETENLGGIVIYIKYSNFREEMFVLSSSVAGHHDLRDILHCNITTEKPLRY